MELKPITLTPPINATLVTDGAGLEKVQSFFSRSQDHIIGWDKETNFTKDFWWRRARTWQVGNMQEQYVVDLLAFCDGKSELLRDCQGDYGKNLIPQLQPVLDVFTPVLCDNKFLKVGVNLGFEYEVSRWGFGLRPWHFFDCSLIERVIYAGLHSLKDYDFYSMESLMARYFGMQIDKTLQTSFDLETPLTQAQVEYAALDTRLPLAIRNIQNIILAGHRLEDLQRTKPNIFKQLEHLPSQIFGDDLREIAQIENNAIGAFIDMHLHGDRLDRERWTARIEKRKLELAETIKTLDSIFIPLVGNKTDVVTDEQIERAESEWKLLTVVTDNEVELRNAARWEKDPIKKAELKASQVAAETSRKAEKDRLKKISGDLKKKRTAQSKLIAKCEGEALINYGSGEQLLIVFPAISKELKNVKDTEDETLEKFEHIPAIKALRDYRTLSKEIGTYGLAWATEWTTHPGKEEGWLHPGDGKLHCTFNQLDAETGRSTSERPNGQNLPKAKEVRGCFISDPPNENIRVSVCKHQMVFDPAENWPPYSKDIGYYCGECQKGVETVPEEYVLVTADMSGAELRILAEEADDPIWIGAFNRGEDVHSVCTELVEGEVWKQLALPNCAYFELKPDGTFKKAKCKCPEHNALRDGMKPTNFGIPYGIAARSLSVQIKKSEEDTIKLLNAHHAKFPKIWDYVDASGNRAKTTGKAFDMYGRRRIFTKPNWDTAKLYAKKDGDKRLRFPDEICEKNLADFVALYGRKAQGRAGEVDSELWRMTHREPTEKEIARAYKGMGGSIERQGKNHPIQGTNATIAKVSMGCGFTPDGTPMLWHSLPKYRARLIKFVHDELVAHCPKQYGKAVAELIGEAFKKGAAIKMKKVVMEFDYNIDTYWKK